MIKEREKKKRKKGREGEVWIQGKVRGKTEERQGFKGH